MRVKRGPGVGIGGERSENPESEYEYDPYAHRSEPSEAEHYHAGDHT